MKALIADDDEFYLKTMTEMVEACGHQVVPVSTGQSALEKARKEGFDLFLLDVYLADMTAMELIPQLKSLWPETPIITLTGHSTRQLELELRELGISYYMSKPVSKNELKSILDHMSKKLF